MCFRRETAERQQKDSVRDAARREWLVWGVCEKLVVGAGVTGGRGGNWWLRLWLVFGSSDIWRAWQSAWLGSTFVFLYIRGIVVQNAQGGGGAKSIVV